MEMYTELTTHPLRWKGVTATGRSILGICRVATEPHLCDLEDALDPRSTTTEPDATTGPDSSQTNDQRRRMRSKGSVARLCHEEHKRGEGC